MQIFDEVRESLVTYYILPLCGISYRAFGIHFLDCRLAKNHKEVVVTLMPFCEEEYFKNVNFKCEHTDNLTTFVRFTIPEKFKSSVEEFAKGNYSKMSPGAKENIYKHSGLHYNKSVGDHKVTDMKLLALSKHKSLRLWLMDNCGLKLCDKGEFIVLENPNSIYYDNK